MVFDLPIDLVIDWEKLPSMVESGQGTAEPPTQQTIDESVAGLIESIEPEPPKST